MRVKSVQMGGATTRIKRVSRVYLCNKYNIYMLIFFGYCNPFSIFFIVYMCTPFNRRHRCFGFPILLLITYFSNFGACNQKSHRFLISFLNNILLLNMVMTSLRIMLLAVSGPNPRSTSKQPSAFTTFPTKR